MQEEEKESQFNFDTGSVTNKSKGEYVKQVSKQTWTPEDDEKLLAAVK